MVVIILGQIGDYLLFKETQRILINTVKYEMTEEFNKKLAHEKFKFQIRMMGLSVIVFMGIPILLFVRIMLLSLKGFVIDSKAPVEKNKLVTANIL